MRSPACLVALCMLAACNNAPLATTLTATSPRPAPDVFECARAQLKAIRFDQTRSISDAQRIRPGDIDETARRPDTQFRRMIDRLEIRGRTLGQTA